MKDWYEEFEEKDCSEEMNRQTVEEETEPRFRKTQKKRHVRKALVAMAAALILGGAAIGASWLAGANTVAAEEQPAADEAEETQEQEEPAELETQISTAELDAEKAQIVKALDVTEGVEVAMPSVVAITTTAVYQSYYNNTMDPFYYFFYGYGYDGGNQGGQEYQVTGAGSGIIIGDDGEELWIVTNNHVVEDADTLTVSFVDETTADGTVLGTDSRNDLAVVAVKLADLSEETKQAIKAIKMGDSDSLRLGETVIAIGNALGLGQSVSTGVVSAVNREITTSKGTKLTTIQTDAAINPGNSGGALLDANGELIGINVAKDAETDVEGMGYAIPISSAKSIISRLTIRREPVSEEDYPYIGVQLQDISSDVAAAYRMPQGILVYGLVEDGPAKKAGMLEQDIITGFNGVPLTSYEELTNELQYVAGGTEVTVTVQRLENGSYNEKELTLTLGYRKDYQTSSQSQNQKGQQQSGQNGDNSQNGQNGQNGSRGGWGGFNFGGR